MPRAAGPGLVALLASLVVAGGSAAVTLGELETNSSLGQPFAGVVRIEAAAGEVIRRECFAPGPDFAAVPDVPRIEDVRFSLEQRAGENLLRIASRTPVREPLIQFVLQMRCPGLPSITRSFLVLMDPASIIPATEFVPVRTSVTPDALPAASPARAGVATAGDIAPGSRYTVRPGDTLSGIASRIAGRPPFSVWPLAARIQRTNPGAFENGRPDRLIAGATLAVPTLDQNLLDSAASSGRAPREDRASYAAGSQPKAAQQLSSRSDPAGAPPVVAGFVLSAGGVELDYLVLTPALSDLSRSRIRQRAAKSAQAPPSVASPSGTTDVSAQPSAAAEAVSAADPAPATSAGWSSLWWWALLLGALTMVLALTSLFFFRLRKPPVEAGVEESPWDVDETAEQEMVYDDFEGTFVPKQPGQLNVGARDPEDDIQTHLMPALESAATSSAQGRPEGTELEAGSITLGDGDFPRLPDRAPGEVAGTVVEPLESTEDDDDESGWVDLDFEATQILEQDYLAEYAASLKEKVKEQSGEHPVPETLPSGADAGEVLLEASDLMETLEEASGEDKQSGDAAGDPPAGTQSPADSGSEDDAEEAMTLTLDDNVFAIDAGKKTSSGDDDDQGGKKIKGGTKKT